MATFRNLERDRTDRGSETSPGSGTDCSSVCPVEYQPRRYRHRFFRGKVYLCLLRPVTAVQIAGIDGNPETEPDPAWLPPTTKTAPDPSYPGAHSAISAAAAEVLRFIPRRSDHA